MCRHYFINTLPGHPTRINHLIPIGLDLDRVRPGRVRDSTRTPDDWRMRCPKAHVRGEGQSECAKPCTRCSLCLRRINRWCSRSFLRHLVSVPGRRWARLENNDDGSVSSPVTILLLRFARKCCPFYSKKGFLDATQIWGFFPSCRPNAGLVVSTTARFYAIVRPLYNEIKPESWAWIH
ncbi:hypothetical protein B296_00045880 [Ensete ventricosum]|uniref:Uncharacterized protein n=1 Tax=Ensete ventricosum TaxID=4639 RepID=A0A426XJU9_ENSVE|nr:hypothetical protein B296_00045880 [Ensete ventricosum]